MSHLEKDILKGKFGKNPQLKKEAKEELTEEKIEKKTGRHVKIREVAGKMKQIGKQMMKNPHKFRKGANEWGDPSLKSLFHPFRDTVSAFKSIAHKPPSFLDEDTDERVE